MGVLHPEPADRRSVPLHLRLLSDERLARRAGNGDRRAFATIQERHRQDLYRFCLAMTGNAEDAETALRNAMVKAQRGLEGGERKIKLKPWLYRITRNETLAAPREPHHAVTLDRDHHHLLADLEQLPQLQRAVLVMRELSGLDFDLIGDAFGISAEAALETVYEARLTLRHLQEGREEDCAKVMWELSEIDGRASRRRRIRAHLRDCPTCRTFRDEISARRDDLAALPPLPLAGGGSGLAGAFAAMAGNTAATSVAIKATATVAVVAATGLSAAERDSRTDPPRPGEGGSAREASWRAPVAHLLPPGGGVQTSTIAVRQSVAVPGALPYRAPAVQRSEPRDADRPVDRDSIGEARPSPEPLGDDPSPTPTDGSHEQSPSQPHDGSEEAVEEATHELQDATVSDAGQPVPSPGAEMPPIDAAEEPTSPGNEPPATPAPAPELETPVPPPPPPASESGPPRRPGEWPRGRRPRHRH